MLRNRPGSIIKRLIKVNMMPGGNRPGFIGQVLLETFMNWKKLVTLNDGSALMPFDFAHDNSF